MPEPQNTASATTGSKEHFAKASEDVQHLIKCILQEERQVMHMRRRDDIHKNILEHVKRLVK